MKKGLTLIELVVTLAISLMIFQILFTGYLTFFRLWDGGIQDTLRMMRAIDVVHTIESTAQTIPLSFANDRTLIFNNHGESDTYEFREDDSGMYLIHNNNKLLAVKGVIGSKNFFVVSNGNRDISGELQLVLFHDEVTLRLYARRMSL